MGREIHVEESIGSGDLPTESDVDMVTASDLQLISVYIVLFLFSSICWTRILYQSEFVIRTGDASYLVYVVTPALGNDLEKL